MAYSSWRSRRRSRGTKRTFGRQARLVRSRPLRAVHFFFTNSTSAAPVSPVANAALGATVLMNGITRGTSILERTGNRIKMMSLLIRGGIYFNPFQTAYYSYTSPNIGTVSNASRVAQEFVLMVAYSSAPLVAYPTASAILAPSTTGLVDTWSMPLVTDFPTMKLVWAKRFSMKTIPNGNNGAVDLYAAVPPVIPISLNIPLNGLMTSFNNVTTAPAVGDIVSGSLWIMMLGDYGVPGGSAPQYYNRPCFAYDARLAFTNLD